MEWPKISTWPHTDGQTDGQTYISTSRAAPSQLKTPTDQISYNVLFVPRIKEEVDEDEADLTGIGGFDPVLLVFLANMVL